MTHEDEKYLHLISIVQYIAGTIFGFIACIPMLYLGFGLMMMNKDITVSSSSGTPPETVATLFVVIGIVATFIGLLIALCILLTGRYIQQRKKRTFCMIIAAIQCLNVPIGTIIGVCTLIVINRPTVIEEFDKPDPYALKQFD